jgi:hypothetical protein
VTATPAGDAMPRTANAGEARNGPKSDADQIKSAVMLASTGKRGRPSQQTTSESPRRTSAIAGASGGDSGTVSEVSLVRNTRSPTTGERQAGSGCDELRPTATTACWAAHYADVNASAADVEPATCVLRSRSRPRVP